MGKIQRYAKMLKVDFLAHSVSSDFIYLFIYVYLHVFPTNLVSCHFHYLIDLAVGTNSVRERKKCKYWLEEAVSHYLQFK
jgi:hypothetical protein